MHATMQALPDIQQAKCEKRRNNAQTEQQDRQSSFDPHHHARTADQTIPAPFMFRVKRNGLRIGPRQLPVEPKH